MRRIALFSMVVAGLLGLVSGCQRAVLVEDDLDFELFDYRLHTPYVVGAQVSISARQADDGSVAGWSGEAKHPSVFRVDHYYESGNTLHLECVAAGPGVTELLILDNDGDVEATRRIRVEAPDRIELVPAGLIKVLGDDAPGLNMQRPVRVLVGGTATFEVRYYRGAERLFGNGVLSVVPSGLELLAEPDTTFLFENREWLRLTPDASGMHEVTLFVGGQEYGVLRVEAVSEEVIDNVEIMAESTEGAEKDDLFYLLARAYDAQGGDVWGVDFDWAVDGEAAGGEGDLFWYYFLKDADTIVRASRAGASDEVVVFMSEGGVTSSNEIGCNTAGGAPDAGLALVLLGLIGLMVVRRRRR